MDVAVAEALVGVRTEAEEAHGEEFEVEELELATEEEEDRMEEVMPEEETTMQVEQMSGNTNR